MVATNPSKHDIVVDRGVGDGSGGGGFDLNPSYAFLSQFISLSISLEDRKILKSKNWKSFGTGLMRCDYEM